MTEALSTSVKDRTENSWKLHIVMY